MKPAASSNSPLQARILLIDDNKLGLAARKAVLEEHGYEVETATNGQEALERCAEKSFELVVTDYRMPRMNGAEFIQEFRLRDQNTPVILLTGYADTLGLNEKNTGADAVIQKSANEVTLMVRTVKRLLRQAPQKKPPVPKAAPPRLRRKTGA
jgi:CheY-like chemotaxis protein